MNNLLVGTLRPPDLSLWRGAFVLLLPILSGLSKANAKRRGLF